MSLFELRSRTLCWVRMTGSGAWSTYQKPMNLKIERAHPHKSPAAYISWYHKLLVISVNKIEGKRQKEVSLWQPLGATRYVGRGIMKRDNLLLTLTSCWKDTNLNQSPWLKSRKVVTNIFCKISKELSCCRNQKLALTHIWRPQWFFSRTWGYTKCLCQVVKVWVCLQ